MKNKLLTTLIFLISNQVIAEVGGTFVVINSAQAKTGGYILKDCDLNKPIHGSWITNPENFNYILPGVHQSYSMSKHGHGVQGNLSCSISYSKNPNITKDDIEDSIKVGIFTAELNNDGVNYNVIPYISSEDQGALSKIKFKYTLNSKINNKEGEFSIELQNFM